MPEVLTTVDEGDEMETGKVEFAPDYKSKKKGVMFSRQTGGAYADLREVIEDELEQIGREDTDHGREAEHERLKDAVLEAAIETYKMEHAADYGSNTITRVDALIKTQRAMKACREAVAALIAYESEHGLTK